MPGMETGAPERTETSSGTGPPPKLRFVSSSRAATCARTASVTPAGSFPVATYSAQARVVMMKPGGTGSPALLMRASPAPLPPSSATSSGSASSKR